MPASARPAPEAFRRGLSAVVANPGLILAPLAFGLAVFASIVAPMLLLLLRVGVSFWPGGTAALLRDPARLPDRLGDFLEGLMAAPFALVGGLLSLLVVLLLLTLLAAYIRAGITGCLLAIDAHAAEDAPLSAFRHPGLASVFFSSARRGTGRFFALVNIYGLALACVVLVLVLPLGIAVVAGLSERVGITVFAFVLFLVALPLVIGGSVALRVLYLVACRLAVSEDVDGLEAFGRAVAWTRASLSAAVVLYLLTLAAGLVTGFAFAIPRFALTLVGGNSFATFALGSAVIILAQTLVGFAYDLTVSGSFVSLWPAAPTADVPPPGARPNIADTSPPVM